MVKKNKEEIRIYFCPKCKSTNVKYIFELSNLFGVIPKQRCAKCDLEMHGFPILVTNKKQIRNHKKYKEKR